MITDRNVRGIWVEHVFDGTGRKTVLVVETDLQLDPADMCYDADQVEALCKDLEQHRQDIAYLDAIQLVRRRVPLKAEPVEMTGTLGDVKLELPCTFDTASVAPVELTTNDRLRAF
jgi:hypothetical protein